MAKYRVTSALNSFQLASIIFMLICASDVFALANQERKQAQKQKLIFSTSSHPAVTKLYQPLIVATYAQLNIELEFVNINEERSLRLLNAGEIDGDVIRTEAVLEAASDFIPVYMLGDAKVYLVCQINIECTHSTLQEKHRILGTVAGSMYYKKYLAGTQIGRMKYTNYDLLRESFKQKRIDALIQVINNQYPVATIPDNANSMLLGNIHGYHLLHKKHAPLAKQVQAALELLSEEKKHLEILTANPAVINEPRETVKQPKITPPRKYQEHLRLRQSTR